RSVVPDSGDSAPLRFAAWMMSAGAPRLVYRGLAEFVFPGAALLLVLILGVITVERSWLTVATGWGGVCAEQVGPVPIGERAVIASVPFRTSVPCWPTGLAVEKGRKYRIWIEIADPWFDHTIISGVNGFNDNGPVHVLAFPIRRWVSAGWFQPVLRVGS